ncbi:MAG TPA: membrane dipeptidase [Hellea balneolensis]|uniref:Membrane dipeptidase n=1 Tax=Hellea balneolensis TaxID=287478 RepID=A0A7C5LYS2_9PROT|nr:membrane dipeptidase [Hellea balneolensis]
MRYLQTGMAVIVPTMVLMMSACTPSGEKEKAQAPKSKPVSIKTIHDNALVLDSHIDLELEMIADDMDPWSSGETRANLDKMEAGGMDGAFLIVYTGQGEINAEGVAKAREIAETRYQAMHRLVEKYPERIELALNSMDAKRLHKAGKRIEFIGMENAYPLGFSVQDVPMWAERGVRYLGITHMGHNQFGDSSNPSYARGESKSLHGGLSPLGRELVKALNDNGIMVDVSHTAKSTMMQATALSKVPVIASHSGVDGVSKNLRNLDDEQLQALAKNGGVIQIVAYGGYLKDLTPEQQAFKDKVRKEMGLEDDMAFLAMDDATEKIFDEKMKAAKKMAPPASVKDLVDHIDYVVKTIGIDHVGIASDFDGGGKIDGWMDASQTENVTAELVKRGYSQEDINKIWGGNLLRVLDAVEAYAQK